MTELFFSNSFSQLCFRAYDVLWQTTPFEEPAQQLLQTEHLKALRFYDQIRLRLGEKIELAQLMDVLDLNIDELLELFFVVYVKQGKDSIYLFTNNSITYLVYQGISLSSM